MKRRLDKGTEEQRLKETNINTSKLSKLSGKQLNYNKLSRIDESERDRNKKRLSKEEDLVDYKTYDYDKKSRKGYKGINIKRMQKVNTINPKYKRVGFLKNTIPKITLVAVLILLVGGVGTKAYNQVVGMKNGELSSSNISGSIDSTTDSGVALKGTGNDNSVYNATVNPISTYTNIQDAMMSDVTNYTGILGKITKISGVSAEGSYNLTQQYVDEYIKYAGNSDIVKMSKMFEKDAQELSNANIDNLTKNELLEKIFEAEVVKESQNGLANKYNGYYEELINKYMNYK